MKKYQLLSIPILAALSSTILLSLFASTYAFGQDATHSEEYMQQHDGGDRAEYSQEMEHSDPWFYVPPSNDVSLQTSD